MGVHKGRKYTTVGTPVGGGGSRQAAMHCAMGAGSGVRRGAGPIGRETRFKDMRGGSVGEGRGLGAEGVPL
jgi:hypothetical protein